MKYCSTCGAKNDDGAHYCAECGKSLKDIERSNFFRIGSGLEENTRYTIGMALASASCLVTMFFPVVRTVPEGEQVIAEFIEFSGLTFYGFLIDVYFLAYLFSNLYVVSLLLRCMQGLQNKSPMPLEQRNKKSVFDIKSVFLYIKEKRYYEAVCELSGLNFCIISMCAFIVYHHSAEMHDSTEMLFGLPLVIIANLATWLFLFMYKKSEK